MTVSRPDSLSVPAAGGGGCAKTAVERDVAGSVRAALQLEDFLGAERLQARADRREGVIGRDACAAPAQQPSERHGEVVVLGRSVVDRLGRRSPGHLEDWLVPILEGSQDGSRAIGYGTSEDRVVGDLVSSDEPQTARLAVA